MSGTTSPDAIYYSTTGDAVDPATESSLQAASVQTALTSITTGRAQKNYSWANAAARTAQTGMATNDLGYQIDTTITYRYSGSAWVAWNSPWFTRTPTLTGVTLGTGGTSYFRARYVEGDIEEKLKVLWGTSTPAWTTSPSWPLLAAPDPLTYGSFSQVGFGNAYDSSAVQFYPITANWTGSGSTVNLYAVGTAGAAAAFSAITASSPFTPGSADVLTMRVVYTPA